MGMAASGPMRDNMSSNFFRIARATQSALTDRRLVTTIGSFAVRPVVRYFGQPGLSDLYELGSRGFCTTAEEFTKRLAGSSNSAYLTVEFDELSSLIESNMKDFGKGYPEDFRVGASSARSLYFLIRLVKPEYVLETGVANGISTLIIVKALVKNGTGKLYSIDVRDDVGPRLRRAESKHWELLVLRRGVLGDNLARLFSEIPNFDIFLHDSNHSYMWQRKEYRLALSHMRAGGLLLSDDINTSWAFHELVKRSFSQTCVKLIENGKVFAGIRID